MEKLRRDGGDLVCRVQRDPQRMQAQVRTRCQCVRVHLVRHAQLRYLLHGHSDHQQIALIAVAIGTYGPGGYLYTEASITILPLTPAHQYAPDV
jgi:hypothetical protein